MASPTCAATRPIAWLGARRQAALHAVVELSVVGEQRDALAARVELTDARILVDGGDPFALQRLAQAGLHREAFRGLFAHAGRGEVGLGLALGLGVAHRGLGLPEDIAAALGGLANASMGAGRLGEALEAAALIEKGITASIANKTVTYDFERLMDGATKLKCSEFGDAIIKHM